ncbi:MAG: ATP-binding protein, partial [Saprospiraceae bacterium]
ENFVYLTTHHFQEPLRKLQTFSDRLAYKYRSALDADAGFILDRIQGSASRLQTLMDDLLLYLRYGGPLLSDELQAVQLVPFLNVLVAEQSKHRLPEKLPQLFWETLEVPAVSANREQLQVLFAQLLDNSLKFAQENVKPVIKIRTFVTNGDQIRGLPTNRTKELFCHIEFRDNGFGFDMAHKDKIFQLFQRLHHNHEYPGTGIGLALCKKIMANHHGFLEVDSLPDVGTTMHLYLPFN